MQTANINPAKPAPNAWNAWDQGSNGKQSIVSSLFPQNDSDKSVLAHGMTAAERLRRLANNSPDQLERNGRSGSITSLSSVSSGNERDLMKNQDPLSKKNNPISKGGKKKTTGPVHNSRYKAKLCKNWMKNGSCPYFEKCQFAHGSYELEKWANRRARMKTDGPQLDQENNSNAAIVQKRSNQSEEEEEKKGREEDDSFETDERCEQDYSCNDDDIDAHYDQNVQDSDEVEDSNALSLAAANETFGSNINKYDDEEDEYEEEDDNNSNNFHEQHFSQPETLDEPETASPTEESAADLKQAIFGSGRPVTLARSDPFTESTVSGSSVSPVQEFLPDLTSKLEEISINNMGSFSSNMASSRSPFHSSEHLFQPLSSFSNSFESSNSYSNQRSSQNVRTSPANMESGHLDSGLYGSSLRGDSSSPFASTFSAFSAFQPSQSSTQQQQQQQRAEQYFDQSSSPSFQLFGMNPIFETQQMSYQQQYNASRQSHTPQHNQQSQHHHSQQMDYGMRMQPQQPYPQQMHHSHHQHHMMGQGYQDVSGMSHQTNQYQFHQGQNMMQHGNYF